VPPEVLGRRMKLHLLGTAGYHPTSRRHTACLMLPEVGVVLDAGTGMFRVRDLIRTPTLDIFLTHAHLDHVVGLTFLLDTLYGKQLDRVTVHGQPEKLAAIDEHLLSEHIFPVKLPCEMRPLADEVPLSDGGKLRHFALEHPGGAVGFRLDWPGHSMAYVTDTVARGAESRYLNSVRGVDLLVHECYFSDEYCELAERTGHSCATPVAELAKAADVSRLIIVHCNPIADGNDPIGMDTVRRIFANAELGDDQMVIEF
jgi:ribonuclease Z